MGGWGVKLEVVDVSKGEALATIGSHGLEGSLECQHAVAGAMHGNPRAQTFVPVCQEVLNTKAHRGELTTECGGEGKAMEVAVVVWEGCQAVEHRG